MNGSTGHIHTDDLVALSALQQRRLIGQRKLSPVELMQACIAHIEAVYPGVNALAARDFERALGQAGWLRRSADDVQRARQIRGASDRDVTRQAREFRPKRLCGLRRPARWLLHQALKRWLESPGA